MYIIPIVSSLFLLLKARKNGAPIHHRMYTVLTYPSNPCEQRSRTYTHTEIEEEKRRKKKREQVMIGELVPFTYDP